MILWLYLVMLNLFNFFCDINRSFYIYFFGGLECVGHYVAHFVLLRDVWIGTQRAAVASRQAIYQLSHSSPFFSHPSPSLSHPSPSLSLPSPSLSHPSPSLSHLSPSLCLPSPFLSHPSPSLSHPSPSLGHPFPSLSHSSLYRSML